MFYVASDSFLGRRVLLYGVFSCPDIVGLLPAFADNSPAHSLCHVVLPQSGRPLWRSWGDPGRRPGMLSRRHVLAALAR